MENGAMGSKSKISKTVIPLLVITSFLLSSTLLINFEDISAQTPSFTRSFTPQEVNSNLNDWGLEYPTGTSEGDNAAKISIISDGSTGDEPDALSLTSSANNENQFFFYDNPNITGNIEITQVEITINALTTVKQGATKVEIGVNNGTDFLPIDDFRLTTNPKDHTQTLSANPHTALPFSINEFDTHSFGFIMQTNAKPSHVYEQSLLVTFIDKEPPTVTAPPDITLTESIDGITISPVQVDIGLATFTDNFVDDANIIELWNDAPTEGFGLGSTTVTWTAEDASGNKGTATQVITIVDDVAPTLTLPNDVPAETEATGPDGAIVEYTDATAIDTFDSSPTILCLDDDSVEKISGSTFPVSPDYTPQTTTVTCTATDNSGNSASASFTVDVADRTPPTLTLPNDIPAETEATGPDGAIVEYTDATASDLVDPTPIVNCNKVSGDIFPIAPSFANQTTTVSCSTIDVAGNTSPTETFNVVVVDTTSPDITAPADVFASVDSDLSNIDLGNPTVTDLVDSNPTITNDAPLEFQLGITTITWNATDIAQNSATAIQKVYVTSPLEMGWHDGTFVDGFILDNSPDHESQIGGTGSATEQITVKDYRGNTDSSSIDFIDITVLNLNSTESIQVRLHENAINSGNFTTINEFVTLTNQLTSEQDNELHVDAGDVVSASYTSAISDPSQDDSIQIITTIIDQNQGQTASTEYTMSTDKEGYKIGEYITLSINDPSRAGDFEADGVTPKIETNVPAGAKMDSDTNRAPDPGNSCTSSTASPIGIKLNEDPGNNGIFTGTVQIGIQPGCSDRPNKIIGVSGTTSATGEVIEFEYNRSLPAGKSIAGIRVDIVDYDPNDFVFDTTGVDLSFVIDVTNYDKDGDGIHDDWEGPNGITISHDVEDEDGNYSHTITWHQPCGPGTDFPICPRDDRKDIFLELDEMQFHSLSPLAIADVVEMFDNSPLCNPGGNLGCNSALEGAALHVLQDDTFSHDQFQSQTEYHDLKGTLFGTAAERDGTCTGCVGTPAEILQLKALIYHYGQSIHDQDASPGSSGDAEIGGNDLRISLGSFAGGTGTRDEQAGTLAHELGHNLLLDHGGKGPLNCKPNLLSVMNYAFQFPDLDPDRPLDYSWTTLNTLDSRNLDEARGLDVTTWTAPDGSIIHVNTIYGINGVVTKVPTGPNIDWNGINGNSETGVQAAINKIDAAGCGDNTLLRAIPTVKQWDVVSLDIKALSGYGDGVTMQSTSDGQGRGGDEPTAETYQGFMVSKIQPWIEEFETLERNTLPESSDIECDQSDYDYLGSTLTEIEDTLTSTEPRSSQLKKAAGLLSDLESSGVLALCLGDEFQTAGEEFTNQVIDSNNNFITMQIRAASIDAKSNGVVDVAIFGTGNSGGTDFIVEDIDAETVELFPLALLDAPSPKGASITHETTNSNFKNSHFKFINEDENLDLFLHFSQREIGLVFDEHASGDVQTVCVSGMTLPVIDDTDGSTITPALPFNGCDDIVVVSGKGKGPNQ
jgi:hypothetical protein